MHIHLTARIKLETIEQKLEKIKEDREIDCESQLSLKLKYLSRIFQEVYSLSGEDFFYRASTKYAVLGRCAPEGFFWPAIIGEKSSRNGESKPRAVRTRPRSKRESGTVGSAHHVAAPHERMQEPSRRSVHPFGTI
jgi:hypothetical protein